MRRFKRVVKSRTELQVEPLEQRNVLSASAALMTTLAGSATPQTSDLPSTCALETGARGNTATVTAGAQLPNSNDVRDTTTVKPVSTSEMVLAGCLAAPGSNPDVVQLPTEVVGMPQSPITDGIIQRSDRPHPPLTIVAAPITAPIVTDEVATAPQKEFCDITATVLEPAAPALLQPVTPVVGNSAPLCEADPTAIHPSTTAIIASSQWVTIAQTVQLATREPITGRPSYRPMTQSIPLQHQIPPVALAIEAREFAFAGWNSLVRGSKLKRQQ